MGVLYPCCAGLDVHKDTVRAVQRYQTEVVSLGCDRWRRKWLGLEARAIPGPAVV